MKCAHSCERPTSFRWPPRCAPARRCCARSLANQPSRSRRWRGLLGGKRPRQPPRPPAAARLPCPRATGAAAGADCAPRPAPWRALTWSWAPGGGGRPGEIADRGEVGRSWNTLALNVLEICVVVEVSDREDARGFDSGRFALLEDLFPPVVSGQQRSTQGAWALGSSQKETADGSGNREMVQPGQGLR